MRARAMALLAAAHGAGHLAAPLFEHREEVKDPVQVVGNVGLGLPPGAVVRSQFQIFGHGHGRKELAAFRHLGNPQPHQPFRGNPAHLPALEGHLSLFAHQAADGIEESGLARAVGADQGHDFAFLDVARDA